MGTWIPNLSSVSKIVATMPSNANRSRQNLAKLIRPNPTARVQMAAVPLGFRISRPRVPPQRLSESKVFPSIRTSTRPGANRPRVKTGASEQRARKRSAFTVGQATHVLAPGEHMRVHWGCRRSPRRRRQRSVRNLIDFVPLLQSGSFSIPLCDFGPPWAIEPLWNN